MVKKCQAREFKKKESIVLLLQTGLKKHNIVLHDESKYCTKIVKV